VSKIDLVVPDLGNFDEVAIVDVLIKVGDKIDVDTPLVTLETDKATMDVPSTASGTVTEVLAQKGGKIGKGGVIARIEGSVPAAQAAPAPAAKPAASAPAPAAKAPAPAPAAAPRPAAPAPVAKPSRPLKPDVPHDRDTQLARYHHYEVASAAFQIGIVLASSTVITGIVILSYLAGGLGVIGLAFMALGLLAPHLLHLH